MKVSLIIPSFNRSDLFARGLATLAKQTMDPREFEILIIDNGSTEDLSKVYTPYKGKLNIRHIIWDHKLHPFWQEMNPNWEGGEEHWYHTPAVAINIGIGQAQGEIICITQPEILHSPNSVTTGYQRAMQGQQVFGEIHMGTHLFNDWLRDNPKWKELPFDKLLEKAESFGHEYKYSHMPENRFYEMYWFIEYLPRSVAQAINGVDLAYQKGVYGEDDQFKMRAIMAGCEAKWGGRPEVSGPIMDSIVGIHQSHKTEGEKYKNQNRESQYWNDGATHNRTMFAAFPGAPYTIANQNYDFDIWGNDLIVKDTTL